MNVKLFIFLFLLLSISAFSCKKVKKMEDDITSRKYNPSLSLNPVDSVGKLYSTTCDEVIPFPFDSVQSVEIDVDKNGENDFRFTYTTNFNFISETDSCKNHNSSVAVKALGIGNTICVEENTNEKIKIFEEGEEIKNGHHYASTAFVFLDDGLSTEEIAIEKGNKFIGIQLFSGSKGWVKIYHRRDSFEFSVLEHGLNKNIHLDITAGQKK